MKKIVFVLLISGLVLLFCIPVYSVEEPVMDPEPLHEEISQFIGTLDADIADDVRDVLNGNNVSGDFVWSISYLLEKIKNSLASVFPSALTFFCTLLGLIVCSAVFSAIGASLGGDTVRTALNFMVSLNLTIVLYDFAAGVLRSCSAYMESITAAANSLSVISGAVLVAGGKLTTASSTAASFLFLCALLQNINVVLLIPIVKTTLSLSLLNNVSIGLHLDAIARGIRKFFTWLLSVIVLLLGFIICIQNVIVKSADSISLRTVKFALGNLIPIVGGSLSDALGTAAGGLNLIKNVCGGAGAIFVVILFLPVLLQLLLYRAALGLGAGVAELLGCTHEKNLLSDVNGVLGYMLAVMALCSLLLVFIISLLIGVQM